MHLYAKFDQNIPFCSRVMSIFTIWPRMDVRTGSPNEYSADPRFVQKVQTKGSCNFNLTSKPRVVQYSADPRDVQF